VVFIKLYQATSNLTWTGSLIKKRRKKYESRDFCWFQNQLNVGFWGRCASRSSSRLCWKIVILWFPSLRSVWSRFARNTVKLNESENSIFSSFSQFFTVKCSWKPPKNTFLRPGIQKNMFLRIFGNFNFFEKNRYKGPPCGQKNFFCSQHVQNMFFRLANQFWVILVFSKNFDFSDHIHSLWPHT